MPVKKFKPRRTLIVPYGLKTCLECVAEAVVRERPKRVRHFVEVYYQGLLEYRNGE